MFHIVTDALPNAPSKNLNSCFKILCDEEQPVPHTALGDARIVRRICEKYVHNEKFNSFSEWLEKHPRFVHTK